MFMVGRGRSVKGSTKGIDYILNDKERGMALEIDRNGIIGDNGKEILPEFRAVQSFNSRCENNIFSFVISPPGETTKNFKVSDWRKLTRDFLGKVGIMDHQYLATLHQSRDNNHVHIIANRISYKGKAINADFIGFKTQGICEVIVKERGWKNAVELGKERKKEVKTVLAGILSSAISDPSNVSMKKLQESLLKKGFDFKIHTDSNGKEVGARLIPLGDNSNVLSSDSKLKDLSQLKNIGFKISELGSEFRLPSIYAALTSKMKVVEKVILNFNPSNRDGFKL